MSDEIVCVVHTEPKHHFAALAKSDVSLATMSNSARRFDATL